MEVVQLRVIFVGRELLHENAASNCDINFMSPEIRNDSTTNPYSDWLHKCTLQMFFLYLSWKILATIVALRCMHMVTTT